MKDSFFKLNRVCGMQSCHKLKLIITLGFLLILLKSNFLVTPSLVLASEERTFTIEDMPEGGCTWYDPEENNKVNGYRVQNADSVIENIGELESITFGVNTEFRYDDHMVLTVNDVVIFTSAYDLWEDFRTVGNLKVFDDINLIKGVDAHSDHSGTCIGGQDDIDGSDGCSIPSSQVTGTLKVTIPESIREELFNYIGVTDLLFKLTATGDNDHDVDCATDFVTGTVSFTSCGDGEINGPEQCDNTSPYIWSDDEYVSAYNGDSYCYTDIHENACTIHTPSYCGDGTPDYTHLETCDDGNTENGDGCSSTCTEENSPWFKTVGGDVYSSSGVDQIPIESIGIEDRRFSSYMCYNSSGQFTVGGGCFNDVMTDLRPTSNFVVDLGDSSAEDNADVEFARIQQKLDTFSSGDTMVSNGITINVFKEDTSISTSISDNRIVYVSEDVTIDNDILYDSSCSTQRSCSQLLFVDGDVTVNSGVEHVDAFIVSSGSIKTNSVSSGEDISLEINGGLVALDVGTSSAIELSRNTVILNDNESPSELVVYDPRYLDIYENFLGRFEVVEFRESGVY